MFKTLVVFGKVTCAVRVFMSLQTIQELREVAEIRKCCINRERIDVSWKRLSKLLDRSWKRLHVLQEVSWLGGCCLNLVRLPDLGRRYTLTMSV